MNKTSIALGGLIAIALLCIAAISWGDLASDVGIPIVTLCVGGVIGVLAPSPS